MVSSFQIALRANLLIQKIIQFLIYIIDFELRCQELQLKLKASEQKCKRLQNAQQDSEIESVALSSESPTKYLRISGIPKNLSPQERKSIMPHLQQAIWYSVFSYEVNIPVSVYPHGEDGSALLKFDKLDDAGLFTSIRN